MTQATEWRLTFPRKPPPVLPVTSRLNTGPETPASDFGKNQRKTLAE